MDVLLAGEGRELRRILVAGHNGWDRQRPRQRPATAGNGEEKDGLVVMNGDFMGFNAI